MPIKRTWTCSSVLLTLVISATVWHGYRRDQHTSATWGCEMSWMTPSYIQILPISQLAARYSTFLYREQSWDLDDRPSGYPVLFVPGNAGSYQQVRSIASSAARQYYTSPGTHSSEAVGQRSLDFFTLNFNEDFSAFDAETLKRQTDYLVEIVPLLLQQYSHLSAEDRPHTVAILGHSMGGIVARRAAARLGSIVKTIITLSTPHAYPPFSFDSKMDKLYEEMRTWGSPQKPPVISICGGVSDVDIASDSCVLDPSAGEERLTVFTTGMPSVWTGVDHQAMVWCHQVRWRIAAALLAMTTVSTCSDVMDKAKSFFVNSPAPNIQTSSSTTVEVRVIRRDMSIIVRPPKTFAGTAAFNVEHCDPQCRPIDFSIITIPRPADATSPFPSPGEGVRPEDVAYVLEVKLSVSTGILNVYAPPGSYLSSGSVETSHTTEECWVASSGNITHHRIRFTKAVPSALLVHRLDVHTDQCHGDLPTLRHLARNDTIKESRFYPNFARAVRLHSHTQIAPFMGSGASVGVEVDVFQSVTCPVKRLTLAIDLWATLGKLVTRYRMLAIIWPFGWLAITLGNCVQQNDWEFSILAVKDSHERMLRSTSLTTLMLIIVGGITQWLFGQARCADLFIGLADIRSIPVLLLCAMWSCGMASLVVVVLPVARRIESQPNTPIARKGQRPINWFLIAFIILLVIIIFSFSNLPAGFAYLCLLGIVYLSEKYSHENTQFESSRMAVLSMVIWLSVLAIPFNVISPFLWIRDLRNGWSQPRTTGETLFAMPLIALLVTLTLFKNIKPRKSFVVVFKRALHLVGVITFTCGARKPFLVYYAVTLTHVICLISLW